MLIVISLFYPRPEGIPQRDLMNLFIFAVNLFTIFLGGSLIYLIKDKIVFNLKYLALAVVFCIVVMSTLRYAWATEICAIPMTYIILYISVRLKSPKFIQENDISYGVYIYAWPVQTLIAIILAVYGVTCNGRISRRDCSLLLSSEPLVSVSKQVGSSTHLSEKKDYLSKFYLNKYLKGVL